MSKAKQFIKDYTSGCSNELTDGVYHEWLTPEQALAAVEIAKEEVIDKACEWLFKLCDGFIIRDFITGTSYSKGELINDFRKAMEE